LLLLCCTRFFGTRLFYRKLFFWIFCPKQANEYVPLCFKLLNFLAILT
jgi:hypothetical protein